MICLTGSANRDGNKYEDPDRFDIHRDIGQHLTFGYGIHFCLGAALARMEGRVTLDEVLQRVPRMGGRLGQHPTSSDIDRAGMGISAGLHLLSDHVVGSLR